MKIQKESGEMMYEEMRNEPIIIRNLREVKSDVKYNKGLQTGMLSATLGHGDCAQLWD